MSIKVEDGVMTVECDWPGCGAREVVKWRYDKGWSSYMRGEPDDNWWPGLPDSGMLCLHHQEAFDAMGDGDTERLLLLTEL